MSSFFYIYKIITVYLDLADLIGLEFWCAVVVNNANASH